MCLRWVPGTEHMFLASHASGQMYLYNEGLTPLNTPPHYQTLKQGDGYAVYTCKSKTTRNPVFRWVIGDGACNEFAFSPDSKYIAAVSQDGFLRVFNYDTMDLYGSMKSYFGGLLCVCWSPDGRYICVGGEDDLVSVWSFEEQRVVARGKGHNSWVSVVGFDPYTTAPLTMNNGVDFCGSDDDFTAHHEGNHQPATERERTYSSHSRTSLKSGASSVPVSYRFGSVGQDTLFCLWDFLEDSLEQYQPRTRTNTQLSLTNTTTNTPNATTTTTTTATATSPQSSSQCNNVASSTHNKSATISNATSHSDGSLSSRFSTLSMDRHKEKHKKDSVSSKGSVHSSLNRMHLRIIEEGAKCIGTPMCPRIDDVLMLEPLVAKKVAQERLTSLVFREDCIVTACQEGFVSTWARPGKVVRYLLK